jgi:hypothetical protein
MDILHIIFRNYYYLLMNMKVVYLKCHSVCGLQIGRNTSVHP